MTEPNRPCLLRCLLGVLVLLVILSPAWGDDRPARPNIVLILADDLGYGDLGCYGCRDIRTPVLDRLAREGVRFTQFYANGPECTPTRTALMTGRYQQRVGGLECALGLGNVGRYDDAVRLRERHELGLPAEDNQLVGLLKRAGYTTALCGKWHLGYEKKFLPGRHGFDHAFGPLGGAVDYFHHSEPGGEHVLYLNDQPVRREGYLTDLITEDAVGYLQRRQQTPFFLYVPYTAPHSPFQGPGDRPDKPVSAENMNRGDRATYIAMLERLDQGIGKILQALEERNLAKGTIVIFASDNGGTQKLGRNAPLSGGKGGLLEGGIRVPCVVRWPGVLEKGATTDRVTLTMDLTASLVRLGGGKPAQPFDGIDVLEDLERKQPTRDRAVFWRARRGERTWKAVRDGNLKYLARLEGDRVQEHLFDLARDLPEQENLITRRTEDAARLKRLLAAWEKEVQPRR